MENASLWRANIYPGPNYTPRFVTLPRFRPVLKGQISYDYIARCFIFTVVKDCGNDIYVPGTMDFGTLEEANKARRVIRKTFGITPKRIFGMLPEIPINAKLPASLEPIRIKQ